MTYTLMPTSYSHQLFEQPFYDATGLRTTEVAYMALVFFISGQVNQQLAVTIVLFVTLGVAGGILMITLSFKIWKGLRNYSGESATLALNQKRIFALLIFQVRVVVVKTKHDSRSPCL